MSGGQERKENAVAATQSLWPQGARIVVVLTFLMENWSEGKAPPYSPMTSPPKPGVPDRAGIQWSNYAGRSGIARLIRIEGQDDALRVPLQQAHLLGGWKIPNPPFFFSE